MSNAAGTDATGDAAAAAAAALAAAGEPAGAPTPADAAAAAAASAAAPAGEAGDEGKGEPLWNDPAKAESEIKRLRREAGDQRINAKKTAADEARSELLATLTAALNPGAGKAAEPATVEQLSAQLATLTADGADATKAAAVATAAWKQGLDPAKADYLQFKLGKNAEFGKLATTDPKFADKLSALVTAEVAADSSLKLSGAAIGSSVDTAGRTGTAALSKAQFDKLSYIERVQLHTTNKAEYDRLNAER